ncbi:MAG TPA: dipeptide epimerase [Polyangiaceae bacterium]|nr:dipeptide epimerase [Polyangiaceae bacterium]
MTEPFGIATGAQPVAENVLVTLTLENGIVGLGEGAPFPAVSGETQASTLAAVRDSAPMIVGRDTTDVRGAAEAMRSVVPREAAARSAVEQAMFDALARSAGLSLSALFGGRGAVLETDMTITTGDVEHARRSARAIAERGIHAIKLKVGGAPYREDLDRLEAVHREAPSATLTVDANGGYSVEDAIAFAKAARARRLPLALFEQPVAPGSIAALAEVTAHAGVLVCADESARSAHAVFEIAKHAAAGAVNLKITKTGVVEAVAMWHVARAAGLELMIGGMVEAELAMTFSAHLASGLGGIRFVDLDTPLFLKDSPFVGGFALDGGRIVLDGAAPGVGVTLGSP